MQLAMLLYCGVPGSSSSHMVALFWPFTGVTGAFSVNLWFKANNSDLEGATFEYLFSNAANATTTAPAAVDTFYPNQVGPPCTLRALCSQCWPPDPVLPPCTTNPCASRSTSLTHGQHLAHADCRSSFLICASMVCPSWASCAYKHAKGSMWAAAVLLRTYLHAFAFVNGTIDAYIKQNASKLAFGKGRCQSTCQKGSIQPMGWCEQWSKTLQTRMCKPSWTLMAK